MQKSVLNLKNINPKVVEMEYAVRGLVPSTAGQIEEDLKKEGGKDKYPFDEILYCNIGNPQSVGQEPITYFRNVLALVDAPHLLQKSNVGSVFPADCIARAEKILDQVPIGTGAYSHSQGVDGFRREVAQFIERRDGFKCDHMKIFLTNGASSAINIILTTLIEKPESGILIPIPQYPIYSALITLLGGTQLNYNLIEEKNWAIDMNGVRKTLQEAKSRGIEPRAMVIINPGNPTGNVLAKEQLQEIVTLCKEEGLVILADEVYQENVYNKSKQFHSMKKVVREMGDEYKDFEFVSFHSTSKGLIGECGRRGGYMEICGFSDDVFQQILKLTSSGLCANLDGQVMTSLMVSPPKPGDESYKQYLSETNSVFAQLQRKSEMLFKIMNSIDGISCQPSDGAMYAFPQINIPHRAIEEAKTQNLSPDTFYALSLLKQTGICCVPGSGFGQEEGTHHIRITFLPKEDKLESSMEAFKQHHIDFMTRYSDTKL